MFDMFDLFISSHPHIVISFLCTCFYPCIPASSYPQIRMCLLLTSHPHILISLGSCTPGACWCSRILTSSYLYVHVLWVLVGILTSSHPHILRFQCSYLFRKLKSDKNNGSNKKIQLLWKQIMALTNIYQNSTFITKIIWTHTKL